jgi:hypothetical protein
MTSGMGQTFTVQDHRRGNGAQQPVPVRAQVASGFYAEVEAELDDMRAQVRGFPDQDPSDVLMVISGVAGRLAEIRAWLYRDNSQRCTQIRTREVDPLREDLELQFKLFSRRIALMEWELKLAGGGA